MKQERHPFKFLPDLNDVLNITDTSVLSFSHITPWILPVPNAQFLESTFRWRDVKPFTGNAINKCRRKHA